MIFLWETMSANVLFRINKNAINAVVSDEKSVNMARFLKST